MGRLIWLGSYLALGAVLLVVVNAQEQHGGDKLRYDSVTGNPRFKRADPSPTAGEMSTPGDAASGAASGAPGASGASPGGESSPGGSPASGESPAPGGSGMTGAQQNTSGDGGMPGGQTGGGDMTGGGGMPGGQTGGGPMTDQTSMTEPSQSPDRPSGGSDTNGSGDGNGGGMGGDGNEQKEMTKRSPETNSANHISVPKLWVSIFASASAFYFTIDYNLPQN